MCPKIDINLENKALRWSLPVIAICLSSRYIALYKQANTTKNTQKNRKNRLRKRIVKKEYFRVYFVYFRVAILSCCMFLCALVRCIFVRIFLWR